MITYEYDPKTNIIHSRVPVNWTCQMAIDYFRQLHDDENIQTNAVERAHFEGMKEFQGNDECVQDMRREYERMAKKLDLAGTVFIVDNDYGHGMARLFQSVFAGEIRFNSSIERVASEEEEAV